MKRLLQGIILTAGVASLGAGCATPATTSGQAQRKALTHQQNADEAAKRRAYGVAGDEQRKAADSHHEAVKKALDEGKPIPPQTQPGDKPAPPAPY